MALAAEPVLEPASGSPGAFVRDFLRGAPVPVSLRRAVVAAVLVGLVVTGLVGSSYNDFELAGAFCAWLAVQGVVVLTGLTGVTTIGQGAFYALGAYSCLLLVAHGGVPYVVAVPAATLVTLVVGAVVALPAARIHGPHLAIVTIALTVVVPQVIDEFTSFTGGENGISIGGLLASPVHGIGAGVWVYFLTLVVACTGATGILALKRSHYGRRLAGIKRSESLAVATGTNTYLDVIVAFSLAGLYGGLGGALMALAEGSISPDGFSFELSASFLLTAIVGGVGSPFGALAGALVITLVPQLSSTMPQELPEYLFAGIPLLIIYAARFLAVSQSGLGVLSQLRARVGGRQRFGPRPEVPLGGLHGRGGSTTTASTGSGSVARLTSRPPEEQDSNQEAHVDRASRRPEGARHEDI